VLEVKMETPEDEAEEKVDDDDLGEDDGEYFIKGDGFKDDSEDSADEEALKQDDAPKTQEFIKEKLATAADITSATAIETGVKSGHVNISAPVAPCKSIFTGEKVPKVRTKSQRKLNRQLLKNWRLEGLMLILMMILLLQVNLVRERINMSAREDRLNKDTVRHGDDEDVNVVDENNAEKRSSKSRPSMGEPEIKSVADAASENTLDEESGKGHKKPGMEAVMVDISDVVNVVMFNTEYEADIIDEANVVRERVNMSAGEDRLDKDTTRYDMMRMRTTLRYAAASQEQRWVSQQSSLLVMLFRSTCARRPRRGMGCSRSSSRASPARTRT
jgi:hypothetical protein